jgi:hypothetical protein
VEERKVLINCATSQADRNMLSVLTVQQRDMIQPIFENRWAQEWPSELSVFYIDKEVACSIDCTDLMAGRVRSKDKEKGGFRVNSLIVMGESNLNCKQVG